MWFLIRKKSKILRCYSEQCFIKKISSDKIKIPSQAEDDTQEIILKEKRMELLFS